MGSSEERGRVGTHHLLEASGCDYPARVDEAVEEPGLYIERAAELVLEVVVCSQGCEQLTSLGRRTDGATLA